jgi:KaiC/GvpD/RAD55 family RecA-like ATPase
MKVRTGKISRKRLVVIAATTLTLWAVTANAVPVYSGTYVDMYLKKNTFTDGLVEEKVYLDTDLSSTIIGHVGSQTDTRLVTFSSTTDVLDAANGFGSIAAEDGFLNNITITAPGYWFEDLIFSVNLAPNSNEDLTITATDKTGGTDTYVDWTTLDDWVNGNNRILVLSTTGNLMQSVTINSQIGFQLSGGLGQFKQTEISGLTAVPIPAAVWLFGSGLLGLLGMARRKKA